MATLDSDDLDAIESLIQTAITTQLLTAGAGLTVRYIYDSEGDWWPIDPPSNGASYLLDGRAIKAKTDNLPSDPADASVIAGLISDLTDLIRQSNVATEVDSSTIKLNVASTKAKSHSVSSNLTGKTLKLYIETAPGVFFAERDATGADGSFSFTPSSALVANIRTFPAALREPSDGNNVLWKGNIEVAYAADAE